MHAQNDEAGPSRHEKWSVRRIFFFKKKNTFRKEVKVSQWAFDRIKVAFEKVAKDEANKLSTVQEIMIGSTDYLQRIIAPAGGGKEALRCHICARIATGSRWKTTFGGSLGEKA